MKISVKLAGIAALLAATPVFAQVKINDTVSVTGWATGSYQYYSPSSGPATDSLNLDAALLSAVITPPKTPITGTFSVYYRPSNEGGVSPGGSEVTLLDAYIGWAINDHLTLTVGKFLSYLGYESFYQINDNMITLANQQFLAPIPGYHEGVKLDDQIDKTDVAGVAIADSEYQKPGYNATEGDGSLIHNAGFEAYYQNTTISNLTLWMGAGYETKTQPGADTDGVQYEFGPTGQEIQGGHDVYVVDVWASYVVDKNNDTLAAEEIYKSGGYNNTGSNWLAYFQYNLNPKTYTWFCLSGEDVDSGPSYVKYSISPTYNVTANYALRAQFSYTDYTNYTITREGFAGAEMLFKF